MARLNRSRSLVSHVIMMKLSRHGDDMMIIGRALRCNGNSGLGGASPARGGSFLEALSFPARDLEMQSFSSFVTREIAVWCRPDWKMEQT